MPWMIQHKCNVLQAEPGEYAALKGKREGEPVTKLHCQLCGEEIIMLGHELFSEAHSNDELGLRLPPGFVIAHARKQ